ncbi:MAG: hypothetical protein KJ620_02165 [Candidatus Edwardsbacteria bacterium]|nr:hypothetical protein [Candidatus Edwardsbacteria bacterium]MBU1576604.1 hypothetical protein [Candidatus Edwardsbacteria bacterium]MBU2464389.1 hypothetical protein [Candidatus Edwardsbacteria bacterium]MBU2594947.1 hypothetical protein [Candidatus Edwardsbacteria bacterium]
MKHLSIWAVILSCLATPAVGDELYLLAGSKFNGTVIMWGQEDITFVLKGTTINESFDISVKSISQIILSDNTIHVPGEDSWIASGGLSQEQLAGLGLLGQPSNNITRFEEKGTAGLISPAKIMATRNPFAVDLSLKKMSGYTDYHIEIVEGYITWQSILAFPLDGNKLTVQASYLKHPFKDPKKDLSFELLYARYMTDPKEAMVDSDYGVYEAGSFTEKWVWSATKSTAKASINEISAKTLIGMDLGNNIYGALILGYRYLKCSYDIFGIDGWQQPEYGGEIYSFDVYQNYNVLDYRISYHLPLAGIKLDIGMTDNVMIAGELLWHPMSNVNDFDDHILRKKTAVSQCHGGGWGASISTKILAGHLKKAEIFVGAGFEMTRVSTTGEQQQTFYGDDPGTTDIDETGLSYTDIDNSINLKQQAIGFFMETRF